MKESGEREGAGKSEGLRQLQSRPQSYGSLKCRRFYGRRWGGSESVRVTVRGEGEGGSKVMQAVKMAVRW